MDLHSWMLYSEVANFHGLRATSIYSLHFYMKFGIAVYFEISYVGRHLKHNANAENACVNMMWQQCREIVICIDCWMFQTNL